MKKYVATPPHTVVVIEDSARGAGTYELPLRLDLRNHSPTGFSWGYGGSGPNQLALAILADYAGEKVALRFYQRFRELVVAKLPMDKPWELTEDDIERTMMTAPEDL